MKAVLLAGGSGTRLKPLTYWTNKHLLPVGRYPMICYGIARLREAGVRDIVLVTSRSSLGDFVEVLGSGRDWGVSIVYRVQEEAGGIAQALELARPLLAPGEKFAVLLGDNLFSQSIAPYIQDFGRQQDGGMVLIYPVDDPQRYGVPEVDEAGGKIVHIEEKPSQPSSSYCVTGLYLYHSDVFDIIDGIQPSQRGELEITDVNNAYAHAGKLTYRELSGWWTDAGTFESLEEASAKLKGVLP